jgi:hypothetical protein
VLRAIFACLAVTGALLSSPGREPDASPDWLAGALKAHLARFALSVEKPGGSVSTRDLTNAALLNLLTGGEPARSEAWIERAYETQDMDRGSVTFGELKWKTGDAAITDRNAIEFGTQAIGPIYLAYGTHLSDDFKKKMGPHLRAALAGLRDHRVPLSYTNIFLMKLVSRMLIGQAVGDHVIVQQAEEDLDAWLDDTRHHGIHEFDSPTYYSTDLASLVEGRRYATLRQTRNKFEVALDYFWTDIAASFFPPGQRMAGPYSRDYDFLSGHGGLDVWLADAGWTRPPVPAPDFEKVFLLENARPGGYRPKPVAAALIEHVPREVTSRWDEDPWHGRFLWVGRNVALGCTSGDYGPQDKLFSATLAGAASLPQITLGPDILDAPYGLVRNPDRNGHRKPKHPPLHAACVERDGIALVTLDLDPSAVESRPEGFATNVVLPSAAEIAIDGAHQAIAAGKTVALNEKAVVSATMGDATVSIRLVHVDTLSGQRLAYTLVADEVGLAHGAIRLKVSHLPAGQQTVSTHLRVAFLVAARDSTKTRSAVVVSDIRNGVWRLKAALPGLSLELARSAQDREVILDQRINGRPVANDLLSVNGKDVTDAIWH